MERLSCANQATRNRIKGANMKLLLDWGQRTNGIKKIGTGRTNGQVKLGQGTNVLVRLGQRTKGMVVLGQETGKTNGLVILGQRTNRLVRLGCVWS